MQVEVFTQIKIFKCIQWPINESSVFKFEHLDKWSFWIVFNWPIEEISYFKLEHFDKWSTLSAFNWPIDECIFFMILSS